MKRLIFAMAVVAGTMAFAAETNRVERPKYVDPNPFSNYDSGMRSTAEAPLVAEWSKSHDAEIAAVTEADVLAGCVESPERALALLGRIGPAYEADPLTLIQIAAVTQWVMLPAPCFLFFWKPSPSEGRKVWTAALSRTIAESKDDYVRTFCRQQLDLCK